MRGENTTPDLVLEGKFNAFLSKLIDAPLRIDRSLFKTTRMSQSNRCFHFKSSLKEELANDDAATRPPKNEYCRCLHLSKGFVVSQDFLEGTTYLFNKQRG